MAASSFDRATPPLAVVLGCSGTMLTRSERRFFAQTDPLGFILFARNIRDPEQVRALTAALRESVGREDAPILIDQEGGRVQRLTPPHWRAAPTAASIGALADRDLDISRRVARANARLIAEELRTLGVTVDCAPVVDVPIAGAHDVIGERAFAHDANRVGLLAQAAMEGFLDGGVLPVIKHLPGHGRAVVDSHVALPVVDADVEALETSDFSAFRMVAHAPWAMTAHVVYTTFDPTAPATLSPRVIGEVIRGRIGFDGVLISDDLSMRALSGSMEERTRQAFAAGCDLVLHCNGDRREMEAVTRAARPLSDAAQDRLKRAESMRRREPAVDVRALAAEISEVLKP